MTKTTTEIWRAVERKRYCKDCKWFHKNSHSSKGGWCDYHTFKKDETTGLQGRIEEPQNNCNNNCKFYQPILFWWRRLLNK